MLDPDPTIQILRQTAQCLRSPASSVTEELRAIQAAQDALDALKVERMRALEESEAYRDDGASSMAAWARVALRQDAGRTRAMSKAARTLQELPAVAAAARAGEISLEHVKIFTYALTHIGPEIVVPAEEWLLELARTCEPGLLHAKVKELRAAVYPDELDEAWVKGMAKQDITIAQTIDGWVVTGFLGIETGAKLHAVLQSLSVPREEGDDRDAAERRVDALDEMLDSVLAAGLPAENGVRPHLSVIVESETLRAALTPEAFTRPPLEVEAAHLVGFGPIGGQLLSYLTCQSDLTPLLVDSIERNSAVLDVGRTWRLATRRQRRAVHARQTGICATPGCTRPIQHVHHIVPWSEGGPTDLDLLTGLCGGCHRLVHQGKIVITLGADGPEFANARGRPLRGREELHALKTLGGFRRRRRLRAA